MPESGNYRLITGCGKDGFSERIAGANRDTPAQEQQEDGGGPILPGIQFPAIERVIEGVAERPEILDRPIEATAKKIAEEMQVKCTQAEPPHLKTILRPARGK